MEPAKSLSSSSSLSPGKRKIEDIRERMANRKRFRDSGGLAVVHPAVAIPVTPSVALILPKEGTTVDSGVIDPVVSTTAKVGAKEAVSEKNDRDDVARDSIRDQLKKYLKEAKLRLPMNSSDLYYEFLKTLQPMADKFTVKKTESVLHELAKRQLVTIENAKTSKTSSRNKDEVSRVCLVAIRKNKYNRRNNSNEQQQQQQQPRCDFDTNGAAATTYSHKSTRGRSKSPKASRSRRNVSKHSQKAAADDVKVGDARHDKNDDVLDDLNELLSAKTAKEQVETRSNDEIQGLLAMPSFKEMTVVENFRSYGGSKVRQFCPHATREECMRQNKSSSSCAKLHFRKMIKPHTDEQLGDCSFLNTCFHMDSCKYVHYEIDSRGSSVSNGGVKLSEKNRRKRKDPNTSGGTMKKPIERIALANSEAKMVESQYISCDIRYLDFSMLGKFSVIMADPPWDIHMELPYGTMKDDEMRALKVQDLSDDGLMFLWVTGRAMELGRELFEIWGYKHCDELIWVKTNQLQRIIRTGRTGHWINHGKEHCLIGIKGNPKNMNRRLDCDVLVAEVRETSHKPDEIYGIIERLSPGTRKLELFGRQHNTQPNWITLGNQLEGVKLHEPSVIEQYQKLNPGSICTTKATNNKSAQPSLSPPPQSTTQKKKKKSQVNSIIESNGLHISDEGNHVIIH